MAFRKSRTICAFWQWFVLGPFCSGSIRSSLMRGQLWCGLLQKNDVLQESCGPEERNHVSRPSCLEMRNWSFNSSSSSLTACPGLQLNMEEAVFKPARRVNHLLVQHGRRLLLKEDQRQRELRNRQQLASLSQRETEVDILRPWGVVLSIDS